MLVGGNEPGPVHIELATKQRDDMVGVDPTVVRLIGDLERFDPSADRVFGRLDDDVERGDTGTRRWGCDASTLTGRVVEASAECLGPAVPRGPAGNRVVQRHDSDSDVGHRPQVLADLSRWVPWCRRLPASKEQAGKVVKDDDIERAVGSQPALGARLHRMAPLRTQTVSDSGHQLEERFQFDAMASRDTQYSHGLRLVRDALREATVDDDVLRIDPTGLRTREKRDDIRNLFCRAEPFGGMLRDVLRVVVRLAVLDALPRATIDVDRPRAYDVGSYAFRVRLFAQVGDVVHEGGLHRAVRKAATRVVVVLDGRSRTDLQYRSATDSTEVGQRGVNEGNGRGNVDVEAGPPAFNRRGNSAFGRGRGNHDIDAPKSLRNGIYPGRDGGRVTDIERVAENDTMLAEHFDRGRHAVWVASAQRDAHAFVEEPLSDGVPDSAAGAGDHGHLVGQCEVHRGVSCSGSTRPTYVRTTTVSSSSQEGVDRKPRELGTMDLQLAGTRAIVTGSTKGIGRAVVESLLDEGVSVALCARTSDDVDAAVKELSTRGTVVGSVVDAGDPTSLRDFVASSVERLGGLDIYVHNTSGKPAKSLEAWENNFRIDLMSAVHGVEAAKEALSAGNGGSFITIGTTASSEHFASGSNSYSALKAAVTNWTLGQAQVLGAAGVRCNVVSPGPIFVDGGDWDRIKGRMPEFFEASKKLHPRGALGTVKDVANAVVFLASPAARHINGVNLTVDGGFLKRINY